MPTQIWYWKGEAARDLLMGFEWCKEKGKLPDPRNLAKTHVLLKEVEETNPEKIFGQMQGEVWSPNGEANAMIREKGLDHTSMSVGDVVVLPDGKVLMTDSCGFQEVKQEYIRVKFSSAAEVRAFLKPHGFDKISVRWGDNPFGGEGKFFVKLTDKPEGITLIQAGGSNIKPATYGDKAAQESGVLDRIAKLREILEKTINARCGD